jgi:hypothetical protein
MALPLAVAHSDASMSMVTVGSWGMDDSLQRSSLQSFDSLQCVKSNIGGKDEAAALIVQLLSAHQSFTQA